MTTKEDIRSWFDRGIDLGKDIMIVVCDSFDWSDYPVYVDAGEYEQKYQDFRTAPMQKVMEVYDLSLPKEQQLAEFRAFHPPVVNHG